MSITVVSTVWGDWFDKYGDGFNETLENAGCEHAVLVSDRKVPVTDCVELVVKERSTHADFLNVATPLVQTDWILAMGFDDLLLENAMDPIETGADIYGFPFVMGGLRSGVASYLGDYENTWRLGHNPMAGGFAYRKELLLEVPWRDFLYLDWIHFCETSFLGKTFQPSDVPRIMWVRREDSLSLTGNAEAHAQVYNFQAELAGGLIHKRVANA